MVTSNILTPTEGYVTYKQLTKRQKQMVRKAKADNTIMPKFRHAQYKVYQHWAGPAYGYYLAITGWIFSGWCYVGNTNRNAKLRSYEVHSYTYTETGRFYGGSSQDRIGVPYTDLNELGF
jgi:hypothetical protein